MVDKTINTDSPPTLHRAPPCKTGAEAEGARAAAAIPDLEAARDAALAEASKRNRGERPQAARSC